MMDQAPILVLVIPLIAAVIAPVAGLFNEKWPYALTLPALAVSGIFSAMLLLQATTSGPIHYYVGNWRPPWGIECVIDPLNALMLAIVSGTAFLAAVFSKETVRRELAGKETWFYSLFLLQTTGLTGIVITGDMFNLYVFLEITSITGYALIAAGEDGACVATFRYIILGTIGACFYLLGVGYLYMVTGSLNMADIARILPALHDSRTVLTAFAFLIVGIAVKMGLFPLHTWLPDAYSSAPSASAALIAPLMTKVSVYVMLRVVFDVFDPSFSIAMLAGTDILLWAGTIAIVAGAFKALSQTDYRRMLCYIIVAEVGYMAGGVGLANPTALKGVVLHILNDAVMTLALFFVAGIVTFKTQGRSLSDFKDLFKKMPVTMAGFAIAALSIIGVPPTCGFFSKWLLISGAIAEGAWGFVAALLFSSLVNVIVFFRIFEIGYSFQSPDESHHHDPGHGASVISEAPASMLIPLIAAAAAIALIGLFNQPIMEHIINLAIPAL
ncbi:NADH-quinone oxidoreductase subunit N [Candidatus Desulfarcum epimagneticum]|uniref:NADH-quinone oxidoreductase subunit N n=1 Tax=uncultured Desulfobacteraceae bacterium TaxID=218296 RepID=A0A484HJS0_9BACT|nr:NADH-quinone oxidoreductase subunit N [uncultured Desulfobacteraceae bacterium]